MIDTFARLRTVFVVFVLLFLFLAPSWCADGKVDIEIAGGETLEDAKLKEIKGNIAVIYHSKGVARVPLSSLPDSARKAFGLPTSHEVWKESQKRQLEVEAAAREGLVPYGDEFITPEEREVRIREDRARALVTARSFASMTFEVIQVLEDGLLCASDSALLAESVPRVFAITGMDTYSIAEGEKYQHPLFWSGTLTYITVADEQKTIPLYSLTAAEAYKQVLADLEAADSLDGGADGDGQPFGVRAGTGFAITSKGHFLTNHHVVEEAGTVVVIHEGKRKPATVIAAEPRLDIAVLQTDIAVTPVPFSTNETEKLGTDCYVVGYPNVDLQGTDPKVTKGIISGLSGLKDDQNQYQIDAAIQPGNSGGPVVDESGRLVGVAVGKLNEIAALLERGSLPQNVNYCIKASRVRRFLESQPFLTGELEVAAPVPVSRDDALERVIEGTVMVFARTE